MELLPGCLFLFPLLAALLPLSARSGPTPLTAGQEEPGTVKPGYCYHIPDVEDLLHQDCNACHKDASCSHCTSDAGCPGATKCCPSKCGYKCQEPVLDFCYLPSVCGNCKALFRRFFFNASSQQCEEFIYGGCGGNRNNFETKDQCFQACSHIGPLDGKTSPTGQVKLFGLSLLPGLVAPLAVQLRGQPGVMKPSVWRDLNPDRLPCVFPSLAIRLSMVTPR